MWIKWFLSLLKNVAVKGLVVGSIHHPVVQYKGQCTIQPILKGLHVRRPSIKDAGHQSAKYKSCTIPVTQLRKGIALLSQGKVQRTNQPSEKVQRTSQPITKVQRTSHLGIKVQHTSQPITKVQRTSHPSIKVQRTIQATAKVQRTNQPITNV